MKPRLLASSALLLPGPQPPLSHLGVTLLRHVVGAALRYGLYQLGLEPPESPPVRIHRLRLFFDVKRLDGHLSSQEGGPTIAAALLDPGGTAGAAFPRSLRGARAFHRARLAVQRPALLARAPRVPVDPESPWKSFRRTLTASTPLLGDALLAEILAASDRRQRRRRGLEVPATMSREAGSFLAGRRARIACLGPPDILSPSWAERPPDHRPHPGDANTVRAATTNHRLRGRFREHYRLCLDSLRLHYVALATRAHANGLLEDAIDAFFLPLDLAEDLEFETRPGWMASAVASNRREYETALGEPPPAEEIFQPEGAGATAAVVTLGGVADGSLAPLFPLP